MNKICDNCETVAHCMKNGCVPKKPAPCTPEQLLAFAQTANLGLDEVIKVFQTAAQPAPVQEPVAMQMDVIVVNLVREGINKHRARELAEHFIKYTTPPAAQRQWVGLTDEDIWNSDSIMAANSEYGATFETLRELTRAIEAKLKEKNT